MCLKWNGVIKVIAPNGAVTKQIERTIRGSTEEIATRNARYIARPWVRDGDKVEITLEPK
jgi:hypothetical protein